MQEMTPPKRYALAPRRNPGGDEPDQSHRRDHAGQHQRIARGGLMGRNMHAWL